MAVHIIVNSNFRGCDVLFWTSWALHTYSTYIEEKASFPAPQTRGWVIKGF